MWKIKLHRKKKAEKTLRFSVAFKASVVYMLLFGLALTTAVGALTWGLAVRTEQDRHLNQVWMLLDQVTRMPPQEAINLDAFAKANNVHIEIYDRYGSLRTYGDEPGPGFGHAQINKRIGLPPEELFARVTDLDDSGIAALITLPNFLVALAFLLLLAAVVGALFMRRTLRPVYDMMETADSISASDLSRRIEPPHSHDEFRDLAGTFNRMLDRIQTAYEQQKRFVSDASHELRTPLSVILGYANLLRRWGGEDKAIREEAVGKIVEEAGDMQRLVEDLLFLARADGQSQQVNPELFCASDMMKDLAEETRLIDHIHTITESIEPDVMLTADPALMKQAVRAIAENSRKYTPEGGSITFLCRREEDKVVLAVEDTGIGISKQDLPHIFDRFYKADAARTRGKTSSSGLGLAIVKWIVENNGGTITVKSALGEGTSMAFRMPAQTEPEEPFLEN
jgi:two-component system sensor histidine kinase ArlS